jgi:hypothetical protein
MDNRANRIAKTLRARARRAAAKKAGAYDGRFATRVKNGAKVTTARGRVNMAAIMAEYAEGE